LSLSATMMFSLSGGSESKSKRWHIFTPLQVWCRFDPCSGLQEPGMPQSAESSILGDVGGVAWQSPLKSYHRARCALATHSRVRVCHSRRVAHRGSVHFQLGGLI
jgi:hypothetical protein